MKRRLFLAIILTIVSCLLTACAAINGSSPISGQSFKKGPPVVYIHPLADAYADATVGIPPFLVPQNINRDKGAGVAEIFRDVFLGKKAFTRVKRLSGDYESMAEAIVIGRDNGVDLVLVGQVNQALAGTELGGARVDISVRLVNVESGNTVWFLEQTMDQPMDYPEVDFVSRIKDSLSPPPIRRAQGGAPVPNMIAKIAADMADVLAGARYVARY